MRIGGRLAQWGLSGAASTVNAAARSTELQNRPTTSRGIAGDSRSADNVGASMLWASSPNVRQMCLSVVAERPNVFAISSVVGRDPPVQFPLKVRAIADSTC